MICVMASDRPWQANIITERKAPRAAANGVLGAVTDSSPGRVGGVGSAAPWQGCASGLNRAIRKLGETLGYIPEAKPGVDLPCLDMGVSLVKRIRGE